ncbi:type IV pilus modification PilV family protein [Sphaerospermopsis torques-reginae]|uniref:Type II secretion system GspH family protein n=1 Tax=Sphaerospermopsis torques-reginae ITEP-024 TaxID=984208 RepID=A0ABX8WTY9_9CYAN|nr:type II secretion system protein [Sphaerospermopsis torques-reginae]QYX29827.1 type II secretion system GspH family protein [Sphaerospermopsis torques-reginae ITEP-024]
MNKPRFHPDSGFSLLEVLVAILIVTFFTTVAMQMVIVSTAFRARAKEYATAANLIQQDLENIRSIANQYEFPTISATPSPTPSPSDSPTVFPSVLVLSSDNGLKHNDKIQFPGSPNVYTITEPTSIPTDTPTITISPGITPPPTPSLVSTVTPTPVEIGTRVVSNTSCSAIPPSPGSTTPDPDTGLGKKLKDKIATNVTTIPSELADNFTEEQAKSFTDYQAVNDYSPYTITNTGLELWMIRQDIVPEELARSPYDVLQVKYVVVRSKDQDKDGKLDIEILAELSTEVIPNASFQCIR